MRYAEAKVINNTVVFRVYTHNSPILVGLVPGGKSNDVVVNVLKKLIHFCPQLGVCRLCL